MEPITAQKSGNWGLYPVSRSTAIMAGVATALASLSAYTMQTLSIHPLTKLNMLLNNLSGGDRVALIDVFKARLECCKAQLLIDIYQAAGAEQLNMSMQAWKDWLQATLNGPKTELQEYIKEVLSFSSMEELVQELANTSYQNLTRRLAEGEEAVWHATRNMSYTLYQMLDKIDDLLDLLPSEHTDAAIATIKQFIELDH